MSWLTILAVAAFGLAQLRFDTTTESVLDRADEAWAFYRASVERFGGDEVIVVALEADPPWNRSVLMEVRSVTKFAQKIQGVRRVDSLASVPLIREGLGGTLQLEPILPEHGGVGDARQVAEAVSTDAIVRRNLVSDDGRVFAVNVFLDRDSAESQDQVIRALEDHLSGKGAWISGVPIFRTRVNAQTRTDLLLFVPITVSVVGLLVALAFASWVAVAVVGIASATGVCLALGTMGYAGAPLTISTMILPSVLLALGSAYVMHLLAAARGFRTRADLEVALDQVATPIVLSGLTTALGFVALTLVRIDAIREFGGYGAIGVLALVASALTLAPALLSLLGFESSRTGFERILRGPGHRWVCALFLGYPKRVVAVWAVVLPFFGFGLSRLQVETDAVLWFPAGSEVRESYEEIKSRLSGISPINVVIEAPEGRAVTEPDVTQAIMGLTRYLENLPEVGRALSVADPLAQLHAVFSRDPGGGLPDERGLLEQYLVILETTDYLGDVIDEERRFANVVLRVDNNGSAALRGVATKAEAWWRVNGAPDFGARATGIMYEFARAEDEIAWGQLRGLGFALITIGVLLFAIFRWPLVAMLALVPNVVPLGMVFGAMGLLDIPLDAVTVALGCTALGIAVDDTIHVVTGFLDRVKAGAEPRAALVGVTDVVISPLVYTTVAISGGFGVLLLSGFAVTQYLGAVTAAVVLLCLAADLTLLPALLAIFVRAKGA